MEIRALTGFSDEVKNKYGKAYSPLNGHGVLLGGMQTRGIGGGMVEVPNYLPAQEVKVKDPATGQEKWLTVENAEALAKILGAGLEVITSLRGASKDTRTVYTPQPPKSGGGSNIDMNKILIYGGAAVGVFLIFKLLNK